MRQGQWDACVALSISRYLGSDFELIIALDGAAEITAIEKNRRQSIPSKGETVTITFRPSDMIVIGRD